MDNCRFLTIIKPEKGRLYGKCPFMNNGENINQFRQIKAVIKEIHPNGLVVPNYECPFYNQNLPQTLCPFYSK